MSAGYLYVLNFLDRELAVATATSVVHANARCSVALQYPDDDAFLVEASRQGDTQAFDALARRYEERIFRLACRITRNAAIAEDVRQSSLLKAYEHLHQFQGRSKFSTWLLRIALNASLMSIRRTARREVSLDDDAGAPGVAQELATADPNPEQACLQNEMRARLHAAIDKLSPRLKTVLLLHSVDGLSGREIAHVLELTEVAVKVRLYRARARLKAMLEPKLRRPSRGHWCTSSSARP